MVVNYSKVLTLRLQDEFIRIFIQIIISWILYTSYLYILFIVLKTKYMFIKKTLVY